MSDETHDEDVRELLGQAPTPELSVDFYDRLEDRLQGEPVPDTGPRRRLLVPLVGVAAAVAVIGVSLGVVRDTREQPDDIAAPTTVTTPSTEVPTTELPITLASQVAELAANSYARVRSLTGDSTETLNCFESQCPSTVTRSEFRYRSTGDYWSKVITGSAGSPASTTTVSSSEALGTSTQVSEYPGAPTSVTRFTDSPPVNQPIIWSGTSLTSLVNGISVSDSAALTTETYNGTPVWQIDARGRFGSDGGTTADRIVARFDKDSLFPLTVTEYSGRRTLRTLEVSNLRVDVELTDADFILNPPTGAAVEDVDSGWRRVAAEELGDEISYTPLTNAVVPEGFVTTTVAVNEQPLLDSGPAGTEDAVRFVYRRGIQAIVIEFARPGAGFRPPPFPSRADVTNPTLTGGALDGVRASIGTGLGVVPRLQVTGRGLTLSIEGDISSAELVTAAESMVSRP